MKQLQLISTNLDIIETSNDDVYQPFIYFVSYLLRNVIMVKRVGLITDKMSFKRWFDQNRFEVIFDFSIGQLSNFDLPFDSNCLARIEASVSFNPFGKMDIAKIEKCLNHLSVFQCCHIMAIETSLNCRNSPVVSMLPSKWKSILKQLGDVVEVYSHKNFFLYMVLPK